MTPFQPFTVRIRLMKIVALFCFLLACFGRTYAQAIELLATPEDSTGTYSYNGNPIVYNGKLYLRYHNSTINYALVGYDGQNFSIYPSPAGFDGYTFGYQGEPIIYKNKLYLTYKDNNYVNHLAVFDGAEIKIIDNPAGLMISDPGTVPFIHGDKLYLHYTKDTWTGTLVAFDGRNFQVVPVPVAYSVLNSGYGSHSDIKTDTAYLWFRRSGGANDLAYLADSNLTFIPTPPGYDGNYRGFDGISISFAGKVYARYQNNSGGAELAILEQDSLRFQTIPDSLGGASGLQSLYYTTVLGDQLVLRFRLSNGNFVVGTYRDSSFTRIPNPPGFESGGSGVYGLPLVYQGKAYYVLYDDNGYGRTAIFDGAQWNLVNMPGNDPEAFLGDEEGYYPVNGKVYTTYTKGNHSQLAVLEGTQATVFDHPASAANTLSFYGPIVVYLGDLYFNYVLNNNFGVLAKLGNTTAVPSAPDRSNRVTLFPNPTSERQITVELDNAASGPVRIQVFDLQGHCLRDGFHQKNAGMSQVQLDLSGLPAGIYAVQTVQDGIYRAVRKIVLL